MVGSADFNNAAIEGQVNITTSAQQPGSAIKPVVYAAAFEQGWHPGTVVLDAPIRIETPGSTDPVTGEEVPSTSPQNYLPYVQRRRHGAYGPGQLTQYPGGEGRRVRGGAEAIVAMARRMGIKHELSQPPADYGLSSAPARATFGHRSWTSAYATIPNTWKPVLVTPVLKITDSEDNDLSMSSTGTTRLKQVETGDPSRRLPTNSFPS